MAVSPKQYTIFVQYAHCKKTKKYETKRKGIPRKLKDTPTPENVIFVLLTFGRPFALQKILVDQKAVEVATTLPTHPPKTILNVLISRGWDLINL